MQLVLDPTKRTDGTNRYYVIGNGAPYEFKGTQGEASAFVELTKRATLQPTKAQLAALLAVATPVSGAVPVIDYAKLAAVLPKPLTVAEIGAEVIRQMKLPGN